MSNNRRAPIDGPTQVRRGKGVVDDQRNPLAVGQGGEGLKIQDGAAGVADRFPVKAPCFRCDRFFPGFQITRIDIMNLDRKFLQRMRELRDRATIKVGRSDDFIPRFQKRHEHGKLSRHTARQSNGTGCTFERCQAFLEDSGRRVADASVNVAVELQVKKFGRLFGVLEHVGRGLVDGDRAGTHMRVGNMTRVKHTGFESKLASPVRRHE